MKIAVISDTHSLLYPELMERLQGVDAILHAGDVGTPAALERLQDAAPLYAVLGNNDWLLPHLLPRTLAVTLAGVNFFLVHRRQDVPKGLTDTDVVIYGHTHQYASTQERGMLWLNPGSCSRPRVSPERTMALIEAQGGTFQVEKVVLVPWKT